MENIARNRRDFYRNHFLHLLLKRFQGIDLLDNPEIIKEEKRKYDQARLARRLKKIDKNMLLGMQLVVQSSKANSSDKKFGKMIMCNEKKSAPLELQMEENHRVIRLTAVTILPKVGGQVGETFGTLEAHVNGFIYKASSFCMHYYFEDIERSFFRLGDKKMAPLLHFHLHDPIMVGTEKTKDVEFHLLQFPLGQMRSDHDLDKNEKEEQIRAGGLKALNEDLKDFVDKVKARWDSQCCRHPLFEELIKEYEFHGILPSKASAAFALTLFHLIVLVESPFVVVPLWEIEIVNLALRRPGKIDVTVIFNDFKEDNLLQINSIPLESLALIKQRLNINEVKYYVNAKKLNWKAVVKFIADFPEKFINAGGWDYYQLEDCDTLAYYKEETDFPKKVIENGGWDYFKIEDSDTSAYCREIAFSPEYMQAARVRPRACADEKSLGGKQGQILKKFSDLQGKLREAYGNLEKIQNLIVQEGGSKGLASSMDAAHCREIAFSPFLPEYVPRTSVRPRASAKSLSGMKEVVGPILENISNLEGKLQEANGKLEKILSLTAQEGGTKFLEGLASSEDARAKAALAKVAELKCQLEHYTACLKYEVTMFSKQVDPAALHGPSAVAL